jgi:single-stranded-DNA-specific exonuclease
VSGAHRMPVVLPAPGTRASPAEAVAGGPTIVWRVRPPAPPRAAAALAEQLGVPFRLAAILHARGITSAADFDPPLALNPNPAVPEAARRIIAAIQAGRRIRVHGDYDADGITAAALLTTGLREVGGNAHAFIPNRLTDGYGVHPDRVEEHAQAADLLITVDCGVSNFREVARLCESGVEVIVTDHHAPPHELPGCLVVHPALTPGYTAHAPTLTGSGVAYHLLWAVRQELGLDAPLAYSDLAAIGTVADVAPLVGENRALVRAGLRAIRDSRWAGLRGVLADQRLENVTARTLAFVVAPRINAAGRLGEAELALELLTTDDPARARQLARYLDGRNDERRRIQDEMFTQALRVVDADEPAIVVTQDGWHAGVMGIVASKLLERFNKPVFIVAGGKGSVRSTPGISAVDALNHASENLLRFGGHEGAAGFALQDGAILTFRKQINEFVARHPVPVRTIVADAILDASEVTMELTRELEALEPFGTGNPEPLFIVRDRLEGVATMGRDLRHIRFRLGGKKGKQWDGADGGFVNGDVVDAAVHVRIDDFRGSVSAEIYAQAIRRLAPLTCEEGEDCLPFPRLETRQALASLDASPAPVFADGTSLAYLRKHHPGLEPHDTPAAPDGGTPITLIAMPPDELLTAWLARGVPLSFALTERTLHVLESRSHWTLDRLRAAKRRRARGDTLPPEAEAILAQVDPDAAGASCHPAVLREEAEAYRLTQFVRHYRHADDAAFTCAVKHLWAAPSGH